MNPEIALFQLLNGYVGTVPLLDVLARALVNDYAVPTLAALALVGIWISGSQPERRAVVVTLIAFAFTLAVVKDIWNVYYRPRPFATEEVKLLFYRPSVSSFPSLPIAMAFCFAAGVLIANRRLGILLYVLGSLYAMARVYSGVHYPLDVIAGALLGIGMVNITTRLDFAANPFADRVIALAQRFYLT